MNSSYHSLYLSEDASFICCEVTGELSYKRALVIIEEVAELSESSGVYLFLADLRQSKNKMNPFESYIIAFRNMLLLRHLLKWRIALLVEADDKSYDFLTTVILNAGYKTNIFTIENEAINWLKEA